jgi:steroid delta-isomerase-like uncharacterized protein
MTNSQAVATVDKFIDAYNSGDVDAMIELCTEDVWVTHANRDTDLRGKEELDRVLREFAAAWPKKSLTDRVAIYSDGDHVVVRHTWMAGEAKSDIAGFAAAGEVVRRDYCSCYRVADGLIAENHDYG